MLGNQTNSAPIDVSAQPVLAVSARKSPHWLRNPDSRLWRIVRPVGMVALFLTAWGLAVRLSHSDLFPTPGNVVRGIAELIEKGLLLKYIVASLFRVSWGFTLASAIYLHSPTCPHSISIDPRPPQSRAASF